MVSSTYDWKMSAFENDFLRSAQFVWSTIFFLKKNEWSHHITKPTKWPVLPAKTQISMGIHPVLSVFAVHSKDSQGDPSFFMRTAKADQTGQMPRLIYSDQTGQMPRLISVFAWRTCLFVGFVMLWLSRYSSRTPCNHNCKISYEKSKHFFFLQIIFKCFDIKFLPFTRIAHIVNDSL